MVGRIVNYFILDQIQVNVIKNDMNYSGISWYSDYPDHYAGDARTASAEKGRILRQISVDALAEFIAAVKADQVVAALNQEFFTRERHLREK